MIVIESGPLSQMNAQALAIFPDECCGFLFGREDTDGKRIILVSREADNAKSGDKRRRFEITGKDYLQAERFAEESGLLLLGIYHSHPGHPAMPSEQDRLAAQPWFSYVIISVKQGQIDHTRSWKLNENEEFEEEIFSPINKNSSISWQQ